MGKVSVTPTVLKWARVSSNMSIDEVADKMGKSSDTIISWEMGKDQPTYVQLEKLAYSVYKRPIAIFFFPEEPDIDDPRKEFRTLPDFEYESLPYTVVRLFRKAQALQLNLQELFQGNNPSDKFILEKISISKKIDMDSLVKDVREILGVSLEDQIEWKSITQALKSWRKAFENCGIFVFKDAFKYDEVSGFCLYDKEFPIIYINNSMPKTRQIFTLFHELAHLIFGIGGVFKIDDSFISTLSSHDQKIEKFCNKFAGEFLVPDSEFDSQISGSEINDKLVFSLANRYSVSREVILRKLLDRDLISKTLYKEKAEFWKKEAQGFKNKGNSGNYYNTKINYLGDSYLDIVLREYYKNKINVYQVADYLDIKVDNIPSLEAHYMSR